MSGQIPEQLKTERSNQMLELDERKRRAYEEKWLGKTVEVLFEEVIEKDGVKMVTGHTKEYVKIAIPMENGNSLINQIKDVEIVDFSQIIH